VTKENIVVKRDKISDIGHKLRFLAFIFEFLQIASKNDSKYTKGLFSSMHRSPDAPQA
jgi:hypothetical protein